MEIIYSKQQKKKRKGKEREEKKEKINICELFKLLKVINNYFVVQIYTVYTGMALGNIFVTGKNFKCSKI